MSEYQMSRLSLYKRKNAETPWVIADEKGPVYYRATFHEAMTEMERMKGGREIERLTVEFRPFASAPPSPSHKESRRRNDE